MSRVVWDHTVLPAIQHKLTHPALTPARQDGTWFSNPGRMEGWVDLSLRDSISVFIWRNKNESHHAPGSRTEVVYPTTDHVVLNYLIC